jgi:raffinose/stachyose/melibiose transport system permease protein
LINKLKLQDNLLVLSIVYAAFRIPFSVFILEGFMSGIPKELEECAIIDGCGIWKILTRIIAPLSTGGIATIAILTVLSSWNELLLSMLFIGKEELKTLPVGLMGFIAEYNSQYTQLCAGILLALIPSLIFYALAQDKIVKGMIAGALKG